MATLTPLRPNGTGSTWGTLRQWDRSGGVWSDTAASTSADWARLDEAITASAANGDTGVGLAASANLNVFAETALTDVDADFASMLTLSFRCSTVDFGPYSDDTGRLAARVRTGASTHLAAQTAGGTFQAIRSFNGTTWTTGAPQYDHTVAFSYVNTSATKADWDAAVIELDFDDVKNKGSDGASIILVDLELTGTYTPVSWPVAPQRLYERRPRGNFHNATHY